MGSFSLSGDVSNWGSSGPFASGSTSNIRPLLPTPADPLPSNRLVYLLNLSYTSKVLHRPLLRPHFRDSLCPCNNHLTTVSAAHARTSGIRLSTAFQSQFPPLSLHTLTRRANARMPTSPLLLMSLSRHLGPPIRPLSPCALPRLLHLHS